MIEGLNFFHSDGVLRGGGGGGTHAVHGTGNVLQCPEGSLTFERMPSVYVRV